MDELHDVVKSKEQLVSLFDTSVDATLKAAELLSSMQDANEHGAISCVALSMTATSKGSGHYRAVIDMGYELKSLGYRVLLVIVEEPDDVIRQDFDVEVIPEIAEINSPESFASIMDTWIDLVKRYDIGAAVFNQYIADAKVWNALAIRHAQVVLGRNYIPVYVKVHSVFTRMEDQTREYLVHHAPTFMAFDGLLTANRVDGAFWETYTKNVYIRPLPVDTVLARDDVSNLETHDILYLANLGQTKNQLDAIKALELVLDDVPDARLILAGGKENQYEKYYARCQKYVDNHGAPLADQVVFAGYVSGEDKKNLLLNCSLAISTSRHEGYPISLIESKYAGLPLVVYDLPNCEICTGYEDSGVIGITDKTPENMAKQIIRVFNDRQFHRTLAKNAREHALQLSTFDAASFWDACLNNVPSTIEISTEIQQRIYRVLYNSLHLMFARKESLEKQRDTLKDRLATAKENNLALKAKNKELRKSNKELKENIKALQEKNADQKKKTEAKQAEINRIRASKSFKIGKVITSPGRLFKK